MERLLTSIVAGLWAGTLAGIAVGYWILAHPSESTGQITFAERGMGEGLAMLFGGILAGMVVFAAAATLTYTFLPAQLRVVQSVSATAITGMLIWGGIVVSQKPPQKFVGYAGLLDVEVRMPKSQFPVREVQDRLLIVMNRWVPPNPHARRVREEGDAVVLESTMTIPIHHDWTVITAAAGKGQLWFKLGWEDLPGAAIPWTEWLPPSENEWPGSDGIEVRCRWRLKPFGAVLAGR